MIDYTSQVQILHFSDLHFGEQHICNPAPTAASVGIPTLGELIANDLNNDFGVTTKDTTDYSSQKNPPLIIAVSGDFTQRADFREFKQSLEFLNTLLSRTLLGKRVKIENVYAVPGNHDVQFTDPSENVRFQPYCSFYNEFFQSVRPPRLSHDPRSLTQTHWRNDDGNKFLIAEINCCMYVQKETVDASRGQVDFESIKKLRAELEEYASKNKDIDEYIKIAIVHHHVVLLPSFIEARRGVDSIMNAGYLLELLSEFNFHLILHGHKHYPHIFTYEPIPLWSDSNNKIPQVVVAGGSCGSKELPTDVASNACNTYSVITVKWHPKAKQSRIQVITRGLRRTGVRPLAPDQWRWETVNISDRVIAPYRTIPKVGSIETAKLEDDKLRLAFYETQRYHMPVVEVMPSLIAGQAYEVRGWIVPHRPDKYNLPPLIRVEWTAGEKFKKVVCRKDNNSKFSFSYHYWGPMLIQAKLVFEDGYEAVDYVYARMPKDES